MDDQHSDLKQHPEEYKRVILELLEQISKRNQLVQNLSEKDRVVQELHVQIEAKERDFQQFKAQRDQLMEVLIRRLIAPLKLDLGCGRFKRAGFIGVDLEPLPGVDLLADLNQDLPFPKESVDHIFCSHALEHVKDPFHLLKEMYRISIRDGLIELIVPLQDHSPGHITIFDESWFHRNLDSSCFAITDSQIRSKSGISPKGEKHSWTQIEISFRVRKSTRTEGDHQAIVRWPVEKELKIRLAGKEHAIRESRAKLARLLVPFRGLSVSLDKAGVRVTNLGSRAIRVWREEGTRSLVLKTIRKLRSYFQRRRILRGSTLRMNTVAPVSPIREGMRELVSRTKAGKTRSNDVGSFKPIDRNCDNLAIAYIVQTYDVCGGHRIVFEHADRLAARGHKVTLLRVFDNGFAPTWFSFKNEIQFATLEEFEDWSELDCAVATYHTTVKYLLDLPRHIKRFYLVQSDERRFYDRITRDYLGCEETYRIPGTQLLVVARWMQRWLKEEFGRESVYIPNKLNFDHFYREESELSKHARPVILVEGNAHAPKKGVHIAWEAIKDLECERWLLTNSEGRLPEYTKGFDQIFQLPRQEMLRKIYSAADIMIKPSYMEGSPLPIMEAMACGSAVITTNCTGAEEYSIDTYNSLIVPIGDISAIRKAVHALLENDQLRNQIVANGLKTARESFNWENTIDALEDTLRADASSEAHYVSWAEVVRFIEMRYSQHEAMRS